MADTKVPKKRIPKVTKDLSWDKWIGPDVAKHLCLCCYTTEIKMNNFHCGHVVAESKGGGSTVDNLRPICASCNLSMGSENLEEFQKRCGFIPATPKAVTKAVVKKPRAVKPKSAPPDRETIFRNKVKELIVTGKIKLTVCPGTEERYMNMGSLFPSSPCKTDRYSKHCNRCGYHYHYVAGFRNDPCPCNNIIV